MSEFFRRSAGYFLQGLLFVTPIGVTIIVVVWFFNLLDDLFFPLVDGLLPWHIPGLGIIIAVIVLTFLGYLIANLISISAINWFDQRMKKAPLVKVIYFAVKDMISVFVEKSDKLGKPVKVMVQRDPRQYKFGFVTSSDMSELGIGEEMISVYMPFSYGIMGNQMVVNKEDVEYLDIASSALMKFIVSGGVAKAEESNESETEK